MLINKLNSYNKYYIFLHNTDITLLNSYKNLFDYCKIYLSLISQNFYYKFLLKKNILLNGVNQKINK